MNKKIHIRAMNLKDRFKQQFKTTKKEKIVTIALIIILIGYGVYQTAHGLTLPQVANEASYKYGLIQGKSEWSSCSDADGDCQTGLTDCSGPVSGDGMCSCCRSKRVCQEEKFLNKFKYTINYIFFVKSILRTVV